MPAPPGLIWLVRVVRRINVCGCYGPESRHRKVRAGVRGPRCRRRIGDNDRATRACYRWHQRSARVHGRANGTSPTARESTRAGQPGKGYGCWDPRAGVKIRVRVGSVSDGDGAGLDGGVACSACRQRRSERRDGYRGNAVVTGE